MNVFPYVSFTRDEWRRYRGKLELQLTKEELANLCGFNESMDPSEARDIYLPLARLLNLYIRATKELHTVSTNFLSRTTEKVPYIIGVTGSVAVGKSTVSRLLKALLSCFPEHKKVAIVPTDCFLFPQEVLEGRNIAHRKGFPESYQLSHFIDFLYAVKSGQAVHELPVYSHEHYTIVSGAKQRIEQPDVLIIEGLNILQNGMLSGQGVSRNFVSDFLDFSLYVDAPSDVIKTWFLRRFTSFLEAAKEKPHVYFHRFTQMPYEDAMKLAHYYWDEINALNLKENILPFRERAQLILRKQADHSICDVSLRKL